MKEGTELSEFLTFITESSLEGSDIIRQALHVVRSHLGMDVAFVSEFLGDHRAFRHVDAKDQNAPIREGDILPMEEGYCQRVIDGRLPQLIPDTADVPEALALPITQALPIGAHLSVPIRLSDGQFYGTFCCFSYDANRSLNERDLQMIRAFAEFTAYQIDQQKKTDRVRHEKASRIRHVLADRTQISVVYQPIYALDDNVVAGFECLARFVPLPQRNPDVWFSEAADVDLEVDLDLAVLKAALVALNTLPAHIYLGLNVSPRTVLSPALASLLDGSPGERIVLEITEHAQIPDYAAIALALAPMRHRGVRLAVDDAGAGYASLRHILLLKPDLIKLDISLVKGIDKDPDKQALALGLTTFALQLEAKILAEGVETETELLTLRSLGVGLAQGYFFRRPVPLADAMKLAAPGCTLNLIGEVRGNDA